MENEVANLIIKILSAIGGFGLLFLGIVKYGGKLIAGLIADASKGAVEKMLEENRQSLSTGKIQVEKYMNSQYEVIDALWKSLAKLKSAGDELWREVNLQNVKIFSKQLEET